MTTEQKVIRTKSAVRVGEAARECQPTCEQSETGNLTLPNVKLFLGSSDTGAPYELTPENQEK